MKLMLSCIGGISTNLLVEALKKEAHKRDLKCEIWAVPETMIEKEIGNFDVLLISTPINKDRVAKLLNNTYPYGVMTLATYSTLDSEYILNQAIEIYRDFYHKDVYTY